MATNRSMWEDLDAESAKTRRRELIKKERAYLVELAKSLMGKDPGEDVVTIKDSREDRKVDRCGLERALDRDSRLVRQGHGWIFKPGAGLRMSEQAVCRVINDVVPGEHVYDGDVPAQWHVEVVEHGPYEFGVQVALRRKRGSGPVRRQWGSWDNVATVEAKAQAQDARLARQEVVQALRLAADALEGDEEEF